MCAPRITSLDEPLSPVTATAAPGDWPGPGLNDLQYLAQMVVAV